MRRKILAVPALAVIAASACGVHVFDRWNGRPVVAREVAAPAPVLWARLSERAGTLGLLVTEIRPDERLVQFDWVTAPGDGRLYLRCARAGVVGSASIRPRVAIRETADGSTVVVASEVRATADTACESTGQFEEWLLARLEPVIAEATGAAPPALVPPDRP